MELLHGATWGQHFRCTSSSNAAIPTARANSDTRDGWGRGDVSPAIEVIGEPITASEIPELCRVTRRLCEALAYIHGEGIVHRDLKPANVFVRPGGQPTLVDFGLVVEHSGTGGREVLDVEAIHAGTAAYMAPEQIEGELVDARADLFALGCMLYESLTGRLPFPKDLYDRKRSWTAQLRPPSRMAPAVPEAVDALVLGMLERDPRDRIGHASDVAAALDRHLGLEAAAAEPHAYVYRSRFAGRNEALEAISARVAALKEGHGGRVLVEGESGSGKTRLVLEVVRRSQTEELTMIACECAPLGAHANADEPAQQAPLQPVRPLFRVVADRCRAGGALATERLLGPRLAVLRSIEPALAQVPGAEKWPEAPPVPPEAAKHRVLAAAADTLLALADESPVLLLLDDLQWADHLTVELVASLDSDRLGSAPLLVIGTCRSEEPLAALQVLAAAPDVTRVRLAALDEETLGVLVGDILAVKRPPPELVRFIAERAEGNPFFVNEYLRTAVSEGLLTRTAQAEWVLLGPGTGDWADRLAALTLPITLREIVARRISGLGPELLELVTTASILGREFDAELLARLCKRDERSFSDAMSDLLRKNVLVVASGTRYRFAHDKLREGASERIPSEARRRLHREVAEAYEVRGVQPDELVTLAHHWGHAAEAEKARHYLRRAGEHALSAGAHGEAAPLFARALELANPEAAPLDPDGPAHLHLRLADALWGLGDTRRGAEAAERALALMGTPVPKSGPRVPLALGRQLLEQLGRVVLDGESAPPPDEMLAVARAEAALRLTQCYVAGQRPQGQVMFATLLAANLADRAGKRGPKSIPYSVLGAAAGMMKLERLAHRYFDRAKADANSRTDPASYAAAGIMEASHYYASGEWAPFDARTAEFLEVASRIGDRPAWEGLMLVTGGAALVRGRLSDAVAQLEGVRGSAGARSGHYMNAWASQLLSLHELWSGRPDRALELAAAARADFRDDGGVAVANALAVRVAALAERGDRDAALREADETLSLLERGPLLYFMWPAAFALPAGLFALWQSAALLSSADAAPIRARALRACDFARSLGRRSAICRPISLYEDAIAARLDGKLHRARDLAQAAEERAHALSLHLLEEEARRERERANP
jgi:hypothetical protein